MGEHMMSSRGQCVDLHRFPSKCLRANTGNTRLACTYRDIEEAFLSDIGGKPAYLLRNKETLTILA